MPPAWREILQQRAAVARIVKPEEVLGPPQSASAYIRMRARLGRPGPGNEKEQRWRASVDGAWS